MLLDRGILVSFISLQLARLLALPHGLVESLIILAGVRLWVSYPPSALASCVCRYGRSTPAS